MVPIYIYIKKTKAHYQHALKTTTLRSLQTPQNTQTPSLLDTKLTPSFWNILGFWTILGLDPLANTPRPNPVGSPAHGALRPKRQPEAGFGSPLPRSGLLNTTPWGLLMYKWIRIDSTRTRLE